MRRKSAVVSLVLALHSTAIFAGIQTDYQAFLAKRYNLEAIEDQKRVTRREKAEQTRRELENRWGKCAGGRWSYIWERFTKRLEDARRELEKSRSEVLQLRKRIRANVREYDKQIDSIERQRHTQTASEYEAGVRDFIAKVEQEYIEPFKDEYLHMADEYLNAVDIYLARVGDAVAACERIDLRPVMAEETLKGLDKVFEAVLKIAEFLKGK